MINTAREHRAYELMTIIAPELADEDVSAQLERISSHITSATGEIKETLTDSPWGRRRLAYAIRHNSQDYRDGYYAVFHFDLDPSRVGEIERELRLDVNVMRYLVVHDDPRAGEKHTDQVGDSAESTDADAETPSAPAAREIVATPAESGAPGSAQGADGVASADSPPAPAEREVPAESSPSDPAQEASAEQEVAVAEAAPVDALGSGETTTIADPPNADEEAPATADESTGAEETDSTTDEEKQEG